MDSKDFTQTLNDFLLILHSYGLITISPNKDLVNKLNNLVSEFSKQTVFLANKNYALTVQEELNTIATLTNTLQAATSTKYLREATRDGSDLIELTVTRLKELITKN